MKACSVQKEANNGLSDLKGQHYLLGWIHRPSHWVGCLATCTMPCMQVHSPWVQMELPTLAWAPSVKGSSAQSVSEDWGELELVAFGRVCSSLLPVERGRQPFAFLKTKEGDNKRSPLKALIIHVSWFKNQAKNLPTFKFLFWQVKKKIFWRCLQNTFYILKGPTNWRIEFLVLPLWSEQERGGLGRAGRMVREQ